MFPVRYALYTNMLFMWKLDFKVFLGAFEKLWKATISFVMSVCLSVSPSTWNNSPRSKRTLMKFHIWVFFETLLRKFRFPYNLTRLTDILHEHQYIRMYDIISLNYHLNEKCFRQKLYRKSNTHFMFKNFFENLYRLWDNVEKYCIAEQATNDSMVHDGYLRLQTHTQNM